mmetsp:Transcript_4085/g.5068  ORF Transcript_4085/g.5068 Transcript_4085/m.5068 type:complete len:145 (-) Transcript_4085:51-485(-)
MGWSSLQQVCVEFLDTEIAYDALMVEAGPYLDEINDTTCRGTTALHFALTGTNDTLVRLLLKNGAEFCGNDNGETPLHWGCIYGSPNIIKKFLRFISADQIGMTDSQGKRAVDWAIENDRDDIVELIKTELKRKSLKRLRARRV